MRTLMAMSPARRPGRSSSTRWSKPGWSTSACPSDVRSLLFGSRDRQPVRAAAHRRRPRAADRRRQARRSSAAAMTTRFRRAAYRRLRSFARHVRSHVLGRHRAQARAFCARQIDQIAELYVAATNVVFGWTMGITHHVHGVRERAGDRQPGADARHGRPAACAACCRSAAIPTCRASARSA